MATPNPIPVLLILYFIGNSRNVSMPVISTLELESFLDNARSFLGVIDKINGLSQPGVQRSLPDMKKLMEIIEKIPL